MKVLQINCVYGNGSTGKIVKALHDKYKELGISSYVIYGRGGIITDDNIIKCSTEFKAKIRNGISRISGNMYGYGTTDSLRIINTIKDIDPDIVHLHCINGYFCNVYYLKITIHNLTALKIMPFIMMM